MLTLVPSLCLLLLLLLMELQECCEGNFKATAGSFNSSITPHRLVQINE